MTKGDPESFDVACDRCVVATYVHRKGSAAAHGATTALGSFSLKALLVRPLTGAGDCTSTISEIQVSPRGASRTRPSGGMSESK